MSANTHNIARKIVLAIELSNPSASPDAHAVALFCADDDVDVLVGSLPIGAGVCSSDGIMVLIERLCAEHEVSPSAIAKLVVSVGPGGYTALRVSTTTAKVLSHILGCELIAVPTAWVAAQGVESACCPGLIALASKNQLAHCSIVEQDGSVESVGVIGADEAAALVDAHGVRSFIADAHLPSSFVERAHQLGIAIRPIMLDARHVLEASAGMDPSSPIELMPIYAREPDAITQWRARRDARSKSE